MMGLFGKFFIEHADGTPIPPEAKYYVLRYDENSKTGEAARKALKVFAESIDKNDRQLWLELGGFRE